MGTSRYTPEGISGGAGPDGIYFTPDVEGESLAGRTCHFRGMDGPCELGRIAAKVGVDHGVRAQAVSICCEVVKKKLAKRLEIPLVASASIYAACRANRVPITLKELSTANHATQWEIGRFYMTLIDKMEISPSVPNGNTYVGKVAGRMRASEEVTKLSKEMEKKAIQAGLGARNPMSLAAAALYEASLARGEPVTQLDVAEAAEVSIVSLRKCAKQMRSLTSLQKKGVSGLAGLAGCLASLLGVAALLSVFLPLCG